MGKDLQSYNGVVLYVDILGFGALTRGQIQLSKNDFKSWPIRNGQEKNNQFLAANILVKFRKILQDLNADEGDITVSQLSDCFFAWSDNIAAVIKFAFRFMHLAIQGGILCRGGMAYGEIIETEKSHSMGRLILGNAVTKAVELEGLAKGARILITDDLPAKLYSQDETYANKVYQMFKPFTNPLDYVVYDEFKWYLIDDLDTINEYGLSSITNDEKIAATKQRLKLANKIQYSTLFNWNAKNKAGQIHLQATSNFFSENHLINVSHRFESKLISDNRSEQTLENMNNVIENDIYIIVPDLEKKTTEINM